MAEELNYESAKTMNLAEYKKAFKEKSQWKKAKAVLFLIDYKMEGKKVPLAIPIRKASELKALAKQAKADKHPTKKLGGGLLKIEKNADGVIFYVELTIGGLSDEILTQKGGKLFDQLLKAQLIVNISNAISVENDTEEIEDNSSNDTDSFEDADLSDAASGNDQNNNISLDFNDLNKKEKIENKDLGKVDFKSMYLSIKSDYEGVKNFVMPKILDKIFEPKMRIEVNKLLEQTAHFKQLKDSIPIELQEKIHPLTNIINQIEEQLKKYLKIIAQIEIKTKEETLQKDSTFNAKKLISDLGSILTEVEKKLGII